MVRKAGIREARQNLSALIDEVRKGREILITDRGKPVARLAPPIAKARKPYRDIAAFRRAMPELQPPLSRTITEDREDRF